LGVKPQSAVAAEQLWQLHAGQEQWAAALEAIAIVIKDRKKQSENVPELLLRQRTALLFLDGMSMLQTGADSATDSAAATRRFEAALRDDPAFLPAVFALADSYLALANRRKAIKLLEKSFTRVPHAEIADRLQKLWDDNDGNSLARLIRLIPQKPLALQHAANHIAGDIAASTGLDGEAKRFRDLYDASIAAFGWQCSGCKSRHDSWHSHCPSCGHFAGLKWQQPEKVTPLLGD
jgi:lipopolysaccharide biosynthesis regulator YciM